MLLFENRHLLLWENRRSHGKIYNKLNLSIFKKYFNIAFLILSLKLLYYNSHTQPFENFPIPCCCCVNRTGPCDNCFNLCGPVIGNPKVFSPFFLQPTNPETFVAIAQLLMNNYKSPDGTVVVGTGQGMNTVVQEPVNASVIGNVLLTNT